jgi:hypothetical protein
VASCGLDARNAKPADRPDILLPPEGSMTEHRTSRRGHSLITKGAENHMSYVGSPGGAQAYSGKGSGPRAGFWRRFGGALLDGIILGLANGILEVALKGVG